MGALGTTTLLPDTRCLVDNAKSRLPQLLDCDKVKSSLYKRWNFIQVSPPRTGWAGSPEQVRMPRASPGRAATKCNPRSPSLRPGARLKACSGGSQEPFPLSARHYGNSLFLSTHSPPPFPVSGSPCLCVCLFLSLFLSVILCIFLCPSVSLFLCLSLSVSLSLLSFCGPVSVSPSLCLPLLFLSLSSSVSFSVYFCLSTSLSVSLFFCPCFCL